MSEKRALVAAVMIGVGASDIFTQDLEDLPELGREVSPEEPEGQKEPPKTKTKNQANRFATTKQVAFIKDQIKKKGIQEKLLFGEWEGEFYSGGDITFSLANDILDWIREQNNGK